MATEKQKTAWREAGQRLQAWWDRRQLKSVHERVGEHEKCLWFLVAITSILVALQIVKLWN